MRETMAHTSKKTLSRNDSAGFKTPSSTRLHFKVFQQRKANTKLMASVRSSNFLLEKSQNRLWIQVSTTTTKTNSPFDKIPLKFSLDNAGALVGFLSPNHCPFKLHQPLCYQLYWNLKWKFPFSKGLKPKGHSLFPPPPP